jgi:hypothetical protein
MGDGVSIVIPSAGGHRLGLLGATLASVRRCAGVEQIIVSESGAAPCALALAREHGADHVFTRLTGPFDRAGTLNAGTVLARGREVLWCDGDYLFEPGFVARAQQEMRACGADYYYPHSRMEYLAETDSREVLAGRRRPSDCQPLRVLMPRDGNPGGMGMVRADFVRRYGGMVEGFRGWGCEDHAWLRKVTLLGRVEVSRDPAQATWHLYHPDSGSHSEGARHQAIRRNRHYAGNERLMRRIAAISTAEEFLMRYPPPTHAAPPWTAPSQLTFVVAAVTAEAPAAVLARDWAQRMGSAYGSEPRVVMANPGKPSLALSGPADEAIAGFADDAAACRGLTAALGNRVSVLVTGAVKPAGTVATGHPMPLILARTPAHVDAWRALGLPVWHRAWEDSEDPRGLAAPPLVQPLSHELGLPRMWRIRIDLDRAALPDTALDRPRFWYVGLHDSDEVEILRRDLRGTELREALTRDRERIVIERAVNAARPPSRWTVWPTDRHGLWLDKLSGPVDPACLS